MHKLTAILLDPVSQLLLMLGAVIMIGVGITAPNADPNAEQAQPNRIRAIAGGMVLMASTSAPTETPWLDGQIVLLPLATPWPTPTPWVMDTSTVIPTATPWPTNTVAPLPIQPWYAGGTLHQATVAEWRGATLQNKLATAADWAVIGFEIHTEEDLRIHTVELLSCMETAIDTDEPIWGSTTAAELAALCLMLLKDEVGTAPTAIPFAEPITIPTETLWPTDMPTSVPTPILVQATEASTDRPFVCIGGCAEPPPGSTCVIKGNVNSSGEKIYHLPGGQYYDRTDIKFEEGDRWFCTADEAITAGFRASER